MLYKQQANSLNPSVDETRLAATDRKARKKDFINKEQQDYRERRTAAKTAQANAATIPKEKRKSLVPRPCSSMAWSMECLLKSTPTLTLCPPPLISTSNLSFVVRSASATKTKLFFHFGRVQAHGSCPSEATCRRSFLIPSSKTFAASWTVPECQSIRFPKAISKDGRPSIVRE